MDYFEYREKKEASINHLWEVTTTAWNERGTTRFVECVQSALKNAVTEVSRTVGCQFGVIGQHATTVRFHAPPRDPGLVRNQLTTAIFGDEIGPKIAFMESEARISSEDPSVWYSRGNGELSIWDVVAWAKKFGQDTVLKAARQHAYWAYWHPRVWEELTGDKDGLVKTTEWLSIVEAEQRLLSMATKMPLPPSYEEGLGVESNWRDPVFPDEPGDANRVTAMFDRLESMIQDNNEDRHKRLVPYLRLHRDTTPCKLYYTVWTKGDPDKKLVFKRNDEFYVFNGTSIVGVIKLTETPTYANQRRTHVLCRMLVREDVEVYEYYTKEREVVAWVVSSDKTKPCPEVAVGVLEAPCYYGAPVIPGPVVDRIKNLFR